LNLHSMENQSFLLLPILGDQSRYTPKYVLFLLLKVQVILSWEENLHDSGAKISYSLAVIYINIAQSTIYKDETSLLLLYYGVH
jgi:hypothetical protein